ncbi:MAG: hypothetical protein IJ125_07930 [Atopobiaceae bacterium]|nr:hypothetical protein [Atopobiaceae bacterium]
MSEPDEHSAAFDDENPAEGHDDLAGADSHTEPDDLAEIRASINAQAEAQNKQLSDDDHLVEGPLSLAWPVRPAKNISHIPLFNGIGDVFDTTEPPHPAYVLDEEQTNEVEVRVEDDDESLIFLDEVDHGDDLSLDAEDEAALSDFFHQIRLFLLVVLAEIVFWAMLP